MHDVDENTLHRFWIKVRKTRTCWLWRRAKSAHGYGQFHYFMGHKQIAAHRVSWLLAYGEIPEGMCVLHDCDNPVCVNPNHLFLGTQKDNIHDMQYKGRDNFFGHKTKRKIP